MFFSSPATANVICNETSMIVELDKSSFKGIHEDHLRLNDPSNIACSLHSNGTHVIGIIPLSQCGTQIEVMQIGIIINVIVCCKWICISGKLVINDFVHVTISSYNECSWSAGGWWEPYLQEWDHHLWWCQRHHYQETSVGSSVFLPVPEAWKCDPGFHSTQEPHVNHREGLWDVYLYFWVLPKQLLWPNVRSQLVPAGLRCWR